MKQLSDNYKRVGYIYSTETVYGVALSTTGYMSSEKLQEQFELVDDKIGFLKINLLSDDNQEIKGTARFENSENSLVFDLPILERASSQVQGKTVIDLSGHDGSRSFISSVIFEDESCQKPEKGLFSVISHADKQKFISHKCNIDSLK